MARIAGIDLPRRKRMEIALTSIYGIGRTRAKLILDEEKVPYERNSDELTEAEVPAAAGRRRCRRPSYSLWQAFLPVPVFDEDIAAMAAGSGRSGKWKPHTRSSTALGCIGESTKLFLYLFLNVQGISIFETAC